jgi:hypothetical protein
MIKKFQLRFLLAAIAFLMVALLPSITSHPKVKAFDACTECRQACFDQFFFCQSQNPPDETFCYDRRAECLIDCYFTVCQ